MTICEFCEQGKLRSNGCLITSIDIEGEPRPRIPYTPPYFGPDYENCLNCGAKFGRYHHPWCDMEKCPECNNQLISCDCVVTGLLKGVGLYRAREQEIFKQFADTMNRLTDNGKKETDEGTLRTELLKIKEWNNELIDIMIQGLNEDDIHYINRK